MEAKKEISVRHRTRPATATSPSTAPDEIPVASQAPTGDGAGDYAIGYGKPPPDTRFKPGQSGNPKGRPKGSKNMKTLIEHELDQKIVVREGGARRQVSKREVVVKKIVNKALEGNDRSIQTLLTVNDELEPVVIARTTSGVAGSLDRTARAILDTYEAQLLEKLSEAEGKIANPTANNDTDDEEAV